MPAPSALLVSLLVRLDDLDPQPRPADVKAGYPALFLFLGLLVIVGLLGWSLSRHLRKVETNRRAGLFGDAPETDTPTGPDGQDGGPVDGPGAPATTRGPGSAPTG